MVTAVIDTNIWLQYLIGSTKSASVRVVDAYFQGHYRLAYSSPMLDELLDVLTLPQMIDMHRQSDVELIEYLSAIISNADRYSGTAPVSATVTRDLTDTKFLSVAVESAAEFLVTNDRRHLLPLVKYHHTRIVTPSHFIRVLG